MKDAATRTSIFGLFVVTGKKLTASQVIALAQPQGISSANVKSHLTRMVAEGVLKRAGPARLSRYWPSEGQSQVVQGIADRLQEDSREPWHGEWLMLSLRLPSRRAFRERLKASLWFDGFRPWTTDTWIRPAWPHDWALAKANAYLEWTPGICVPGKMLRRMDLRQLARLYRLDILDRDARRLARWIGRREMPKLAEQAFAWRLRVGGMVARLIGHDPRLPAALWGQRTGMQEMVAAFHAFEKRIGPLAESFVKQVLAG